MTRLRRGIALLIALLLALGLLVPTSAASDPEAAFDAALGERLETSGSASLQEWLDRELSEHAGETSEWYVIALAAHPDLGELDFGCYSASLLAYIAGQDSISAVIRERYALALIACGRENEPFVAETASASIGEQGIMSWIFGLHLLNNGIISEKYTASQVVKKLLSLELADGGWSLGANSSSTAVDVTAMTIQALAPYYQSNSEVGEAIDRALSRLSFLQRDGGGYVSYGVESPESAAQVITALASLGIVPSIDPRFASDGNPVEAMLAYQLESGGFCHTLGEEVNAVATAQALYSLAALSRMRQGLSPLFIFRDALPELSLENAELPEEIPEATGENTEADKKLDLRPVICAVIALFAVIFCLVSWLRKRRKLKYFLPPLIIAALLICAVCFIRIESPENYYKAPDEKENAVGSVTLSIRCDRIVGLDKSGSSDYVPQDGIILSPTEYQLGEGDSVFDILVDAVRANGISMEYDGSESLAYIKGINYIYEFDYGELSGWIYRVNGVSAKVGCSEYILANGDEIEFIYTLELGNDVGQ